MTISVSDLQKNISILKKINEDIIVIDKKTGEKIAKIEPIKRKNKDLELFNDLIKDLTPTGKIATKKDIKNSFEEHLKEKYGFN